MALEISGRGTLRKISRQYGAVSDSTCRTKRPDPSCGAIVAAVRWRASAAKRSMRRTARRPFHARGRLQPSRHGYDVPRCSEPSRPPAASTLLLQHPLTMTASRLERESANCRSARDNDYPVFQSAQSGRSSGFVGRASKTRSVPASLSRFCTTGAAASAGDQRRQNHHQRPRT